MIIAFFFVMVTTVMYLPSLSVLHSQSYRPHSSPTSLLSSIAATGCWCFCTLETCYLNSNLLPPTKWNGKDSKSRMVRTFHRSKGAWNNKEEHHFRMARGWFIP